MAVELNHTIVHAKDAAESAEFLADLLGLAPPRPFLHFMVVKTSNGVSLDFISTDQPFEPQHYAFLVSEAGFDRIFGKIKSRGLEHWADPARKLAGEINRHDGGRGVYFCDPGGNFLEIITRPYGSGG
ncbi:MAG: VOC family protein [Hyphomonadaceae bacterium]